MVPWDPEGPRWELQVWDRGGSCGHSFTRGSPGSALGFPECRDRAVSVEGSLCLVPEEPPREWGEVDWKVKLDSGDQTRILTAFRDKPTWYTNGSFRGRADFQPGTLSLCISPVRREDSGVYKVEISHSRISFQCFRVSVWGEWLGPHTFVLPSICPHVPSVPPHPPCPLVPLSPVTLDGLRRPRGTSAAAGDDRRAWGSPVGWWESGTTGR